MPVGGIFPNKNHITLLKHLCLQCACSLGKFVFTIGVVDSVWCIRNHLRRTVSVQLAIPHQLRIVIFPILPPTFTTGLDFFLTTNDSSSFRITHEIIFSRKWGASAPRNLQLISVCFSHGMPVPWHIAVQNSSCWQ